MTKREIINKLVFMVRFGESEYAMNSDADIVSIITGLLDSYTEEGGEEEL